MPNILTRRIGPFPGWVWAVAAGGGFLLFMYFRRRGQPQGQQGSLVNNPAASSIPYVPNVNISGIPPQNPSPPASNAPPSGGGQLQGIWIRPAGVIRSAPTAQSSAVWTPPIGTVLILGNPVPDPDPANASGQWYQVMAPGSGGWAWSGDMTITQKSGSGGFGYAGSQSPASIVGGWTFMPWVTGYQPSPSPVSPGGGWGAGSTVNRTGAAKRARRLYGGSGGGSAVNRTGARATRPLRRRSLSGR